MKHLTKFIIAFLLISGVKAQIVPPVLEFSTACPEIEVGQTCEINVVLNTVQRINTVQTNVIIGGPFEIQSLNEANSIISLWIESPSISSDKHSASMAGIIPGGFVGREGKILTLTLIAGAEGEGAAIFSNQYAYLNDGEGSKIDLETRSLNLRAKTSVDGFVPPTTEPDIEPPLIFYPEVAKDTNIFLGQWFVAFQTQDKGAGIDHYEIAETETDSVSNSSWKIAESPYRLKDQSLASYIHVKAVDRAGNVRSAILPPTNSMRWYDKYDGLILVLGVLLVGLYFLLQNLNKKKHGA